MTEKEKMIAGLLYCADDAELVEARKTARLVFEEYNKTSITNIERRTKLIKQLFGKTGKNIYIEPSFKCDYGFNIEVGENFYANFDCVFLDVCKISIGDNCFVAAQVAICTATHPIAAKERSSGVEYGKPVAIGNDCWIGAHATINPGVTLGNGVVVGSGSVVTKNFGDNVVIAGNPARVIREIDNGRT